MGVYNWLVVLVPLSCVLGVAFYSRRYIRDVVDFLSSGRVARRYVISVATMEEALGVISLMAMMESNYKSGMAIAFWNSILPPLGVCLSLFGYCTYRFRETRAMTQGQFLEIRYSRGVRVFATTLRTLAEFLTEIIGPALAARFFIYFFDFPATVEIFGWSVSTYALTMVITITLALSIIWAGGSVAIILTDSLQALLSYPVFFIIVIFILSTFHWGKEIAPTMLDRAPGESFLNPFDVQNLRDFNIFALVTVLIARILNRVIWNGGGHDTTAINAHEQKMAGLLGSWRAGFSTLMCTLLGIALITMMNHQNFSAPARETRQALSLKISSQLFTDAALRGKLETVIKSMPEQKHRIGIDPAPSHKKSLDTEYLDAVHRTLLDNLPSAGEANSSFQQFRTFYYQLMFPVSIRYIFPRWMLGIFCLLMVLIMISTDDSRMFKIACIMAQDMILPFCRRPPSVRAQLWMVRWLTLFTGVVFFICSLYMAQLDYINLFITMMGSIWTGGSGAMMVFGLYSRFGTAAGAYAALISSGLFSFVNILIQRNWADYVHPWLVEMGWHESVGRFLSTVSQPFAPYVVWEMNPVKYPINSNEIFFLSMMLGVISYLVVSLITCREPFNLEKMLHRGKWSDSGEEKQLSFRWSWSTIGKKLIGITPEYTRGDRILARSVFIYSILYKFVFCFVIVLFWNWISPWPNEWWRTYFLWVWVLVPGAVGVVSTFWFLTGGIIDLRRLFRDLAQRKADYNDTGWIGEGEKSDGKDPEPPAKQA